MRPKRSFGKSKKRSPEMPLEKKVESFILRNSQNGYFTKFSTITSKFRITESETWNIVGLLLSEGNLESVHDPASGEMKICESGKKYEIINMSRKRKFEKTASEQNNRFSNDDTDNKNSRHKTRFVRNSNQNNSSKKHNTRNDGDSDKNHRRDGGDGRNTRRDNSSENTTLGSQESTNNKTGGHNNRNDNQTSGRSNNRGGNKDDSNLRTRSSENDNTRHRQNTVDTNVKSDGKQNSGNN